MFVGSGDWNSRNHLVSNSLQNISLESLFGIMISLDMIWNILIIYFDYLFFYFVFFHFFFQLGNKFQGKDKNWLSKFVKGNERCLTNHFFICYLSISFFYGLFFSNFWMNFYFLLLKKLFCPIFKWTFLSVLWCFISLF